MPTRRENDIVLLETFRNMLTSYATGDGQGDGALYASGRKLMIDDPELSRLTPRWVRTCRNLDDFWSMIKGKFAHYSERREWLRNEFDPIFNYLEGLPPHPSDSAIEDSLKKSGGQYVHDTWHKALARREHDPDGAITAARTLLEEVCRFVLDETGETYDEKAELPKLYGLVAKKLNLAPSQHSEDIVKRILGGCHSIVEGLGALRSKIGDAHAKGKTGARAAPRHAAFAVNIAGAAASFILETYEFKKTTAQ